MSDTTVVVHAHPDDDEAIFTAATTVRLTERGTRVVLVTLTPGELGIPRTPLAGQALGSRRRHELEQSCAALGVDRLVVLDYRDSGATRARRYPRGSLAAARPSHVARRLSRIVEAESASALVHYDLGGIYGHPDHVQVHRTGRMVAERLGITAYEATVLREEVERLPRHLLHGARYPEVPLGLASDEITLTLHADPWELATKRLAMSAHASQITAADLLVGEEFAAAYGREWYARRGPVGVLDALAGSGVRSPARTPRRAPALT